ncbi:hypothetical protein [Salinispora arenicola]|uniref:hypothetical protein n=1 Tax=Salinispora arenicola TaxID=168697 RepID=UPI0016B1443B|nr:hypothetical protein [Salinispora arenicola]NIL57852.1 hypothetical protein [Salinispora arenicola]NIL62737.1 hypothetical protein [Salinispora arenicola]
MHTDRTDRPGYSAEPRTREIKAGDLTAGMILRFADGESLTVLRVERDEDGIVLVTVDGDAIAAPYNAEETVTVVGWDGAVAPPAEPDYWQALAADLRAVADRVGSLAGTPAHVSYVTVGICAGLVPSEAPDGIATVDAIAGVFGAAASTGHHNRSALWEHRADVQVGEVVLSAFAAVPKPASVEDELRAEVEALRAQLAEGGAR